MERVFIKELKINKVRHLENITIPISGDNHMRHLLLTGKNGSGKTSVLNGLAGYIDSVARNDAFVTDQNNLLSLKKNFEISNKRGQTDSAHEIQKVIDNIQKNVDAIKGGLDLVFNVPEVDINRKYLAGEFIIAYYRDFRKFEPAATKQIEKVELRDNYDINNGPRNDFLKYLLDMQMMKALAVADGKMEDANKIQIWFDKLTDILRKIYMDNELELEFDRDHYAFWIVMPNREKFDFRSMSSGYAAAVDIVVDLMLRMEKQTQRTFRYDIPGIVLIDEIETHLHLELQKEILDILTTMFPNIQFIVSTHSPFVLTSLSDVTIYDLENGTLVRGGLTDVSYEGAVEGYFNVESMSETMIKKFDRYKDLVKKEAVTPEEKLEIYNLQHDLDEVPDFLARDRTTEYERLKLEYSMKEAQ